MPSPTNMAGILEGLTTYKKSLNRMTARRKKL